MAGNLNFTLILTVFMTCFGSSFLIGYNLGVTNLLGEEMKKFLSNKLLGKPASFYDDSTELVTPTFLNAQVSSTFVVAGAIGAFSCGWVADLIGRRNGLLVNHAFSIIGGLLVAPCVHWGSVTLLFVARAVLGLNCGISIGVASLFLTEVAPRHLRGAIGACNQLALTIGIAIAYVMTLKSTLNTETLWPIAISLCIFPAIVSLCVLPFCPESPRFLYLCKKNEQAARAAFIRLNSEANVDTFIGELHEEEEVARNQPDFKFTQLFTQRDLRMPVLIACLMQVLQQLSGINAVIFYSSEMLKTAGVADDYIQYCVLAIGVINVVLTLVALPLLERAGRRTVILWPTVALAISLLGLTVTVSTGTLNPSLKVPLGYASILLIIIYICGFALGLGPVPALIVSEIFRQGPRAAAYSLSQCIQWLCNLMVLCSYPSVNKAIHGFSFLPFLVVVVVCWIFFYLFMPETKNRTFDEIARDLAFGNIVVGKRTTALDNHNANMYRKEDDRNASNTEGSTYPMLNKVTAGPV